MCESTLPICRWRLSEHPVQNDVVRRRWPLWPHSLHTRESRSVSVIATFPGSGVTGGVVDRLSLQSVFHTGTSLIPFGTMCVGFCQSLCYVYIHNVSSGTYTHKHIHIPVYICTRAHTHAHAHVLNAYRYIWHKYIRMCDRYMYIFIFDTLCMHVSLYVCTCVCVCMWCIYMYSIQKPTYTYIHVQVHVDVRAHIHMYTQCTCMQNHICIHRHTCILTISHTDTMSY